MSIIRHHNRNPTTKKGTVYTIGEYPHMTMRQAQIAMLEAKGQISQGIDPNTQKQQARQAGAGETFKAVALEWHAMAHTERNKVAGAYNYMAVYMPERIKMMQWWADYLDKQGRA